MRGSWFERGNVSFTGSTSVQEDEVCELGSPHLLRVMKLDMALLNELFTQMLKLFRMMGEPSPPCKILS